MFPLVLMEVDASFCMLPELGGMFPENGGSEWSVGSLMVK